LPRRARGVSDGTAPGPWLLGIAAFASGTIFLFVPQNWAWGAVGIYLLLDAAWFAGILVWSARKAWNGLHRLAVAAGLAMAYGVHAFVQKPAVGGAVTVATRVGNVVFLVLAAAVIALGARRTAAFERDK
jgi:hypothetical protein